MFGRNLSLTCDVWNQHRFTMAMATAPFINMYIGSRVMHGVTLDWHVIPEADLLCAYRSSACILLEMFGWCQPYFECSNLAKRSLTMPHHHLTMLQTMMGTAQVVPPMIIAVVALEDVRWLLRRWCPIPSDALFS